MPETVKRIAFAVVILAATVALPPDVVRAQVAVSIKSVEIQTIDHDNHKFVIVTNGEYSVSVLHHPNCNCLK